MSILQDIKVFIQGSIAAGFTAEVYQEYGINAKQVTDFARLVIRAAGVYESHDVAGMQVGFIGHAANDVQVFMLDGEAVNTYTWLERAAEYLDAQFSQSLGVASIRSEVE
jgi:membrane protease subunit (stomatin/prohibitin family)